jgi:hypothetical protein
MTHCDGTTFGSVAITAVRGTGGGRKRDQVIQSLAMAFGVVVLDKLPDDGARVTLAKRNNVPKALDRANEPLRLSIQVRAARWQPQEPHPRHAEKALHVRGIKRIAFHDEVIVASERPRHGIGEIASDLRHPGPVSLPSDAGDVTRQVLASMTNSTR